MYKSIKNKKIVPNKNSTLMLLMLTETPNDGNITAILIGGLAYGVMLFGSYCYKKWIMKPEPTTPNPLDLENDFIIEPEPIFLEDDEVKVAVIEPIVKKVVDLARYDGKTWGAINRTLIEPLPVYLPRDDRFFILQNGQEVLSKSFKAAIRHWTDFVVEQTPVVQHYFHNPKNFNCNFVCIWAQELCTADFYQPMFWYHTYLAWILIAFCHLAIQFTCGTITTQQCKTVLTYIWAHRIRLMEHVYTKEELLRTCAYLKTHLHNAGYLVNLQWDPEVWERLITKQKLYLFKLEWMKKLFIKWEIC